MSFLMHISFRTQHFRLFSKQSRELTFVNALDAFDNIPEATKTAVIAAIISVVVFLCSLYSCIFSTEECGCWLSDFIVVIDFLQYRHCDILLFLHSFSRKFVCTNKHTNRHVLSPQYGNNKIIKNNVVLFYNEIPSIGNVMGQQKEWKVYLSRIYHTLKHLL